MGRLVPSVHKDHHLPSVTKEAEPESGADTGQYLGMSSEEQGVDKVGRKESQVSAEHRRSSVQQGT